MSTKWEQQTHSDLTSRLSSCFPQVYTQNKYAVNTTATICVCVCMTLEDLSGKSKRPRKITIQGKEKSRNLSKREFTNEVLSDFRGCAWTPSKACHYLKMTHLDMLFLSFIESYRILGVIPLMSLLPCCITELVGVLFWTHKGIPKWNSYTLT